MASHLLLRPFAPSPQDPFDAIKAAHLHNRAGFGATPAEIQETIKLGPAGAVDKLLAFPDEDAERQGDGVPDLSPIEDYPTSFTDLRAMLVGKSEEQRKQIRQKLAMANRDAILSTVGWWLNRMAAGRHPLQEKLTLFWHGHFTSSAAEARMALLMWQQNELLRRMAAGDFARLVSEISRDPAMLDYLNNQQNRKQHPNENYARELLELFTLGIGNYTEQDIREAARAFTGWAHNGEDFVFRPRDHDTGQKTFLGRTGNFDGQGIIDIILQQPVCARFIAGKLFRFFAYEDVEPDLEQSLGEVLRQSNYQLRPFLRTILTSQAFYSPKTIGTQIKSPVQLVVGAARLLSVHLPPIRRLMPHLTQMGQVPLSPPNVKGWPSGRTWINTNALFARQSAVLMLSRLPRAVVVDPASRESTAEQVVDHWLTRLIQRPVEREKRQILVDSLANKPADARARLRMVQLILTMPEYQLA